GRNRERLRAQPGAAAEHGGILRLFPGRDRLHGAGDAGGARGHAADGGPGLLRGGPDGAAGALLLRPLPVFASADDSLEALIFTAEAPRRRGKSQAKRWGSGMHLLPTASASERGIAGASHKASAPLCLGGEYKPPQVAVS